MGQLLWTVIQLFGAAIMWTCAALFLAKTLWNFGIPYAIIHEALRRPEHKHGWSIFILLDIGLLLSAVVGAGLAGDYQIAGPARLGLYGLGAIAASYIHMISVLLLGGYIFSLFASDDHQDR